MLALRMRECDAVNYLYVEFLAPYAAYRALRVIALFRLCNLVSMLFTIAELFTICISDEKLYYGEKIESIETAKNAKIGSEL